MAYDENLVNEVVARTKILCCTDIATEVEDHYAGYFDELGLRVALKDGITVQDWEPVASELLGYLNQMLPNGNSNFCWQLSFEQDSKQVGLFFPGDSIEDNCAEDT